ncbi:DNA-3-methyladenine glycosylase family protein [Paraferrimonas sedimenticola]|uniref:DNA-3-methyladenine glycosylase II n=1 Tax=Paraferrimonas sedimenticola TaxID=375674 RepID=A0AA37RWD4_9GAMM|nr:DNA-3-methyladenine glycosylase [Paraferrimonas sedimenticola]GLP95947.1 DNA-3-methyladenine glycosidase [Paraferrimonas sedimenticola]
MTDDQLSQQLPFLCQLDADLAKAFESLGAPPARVRPAGFRTLLNIIVSQQISVHAARAIQGRLDVLLDGGDAQTWLSLDEQAIIAAGLSARKRQYAQGLAQALVSGSLDLDSLDSMSDTDAIDAVTQLKGFGRWSAEIYLMVSHHRQDIFPADDIALQTALARLKGLDERPSAKQARELTEHWAPYRSAGSLLLWHYYQGAPT